MVKSEKVKKYKLTNQYGVNFYYRKVKGVDCPFLWYQQGNKIRTVTLEPFELTFYQQFKVRFEDVDTSYFEGLFAGEIVEKIKDI